MNPFSIFDPEALTCLQDAGFWQRFRRSAGAVEAALLALRDAQGPSLFIPSAGPSAPGRISRGQNYQGYPYRVLDYPAVFDPDGFLIFRTMVIWGCHASFHFIVQGEWKNRLAPKLPSLPPSLQDWLFAAEANPWVWFPGSGTQPLHTWPAEALAKRLQQANFFKCSQFLPLNEELNLLTAGTTAWQAWEQWLGQP